MCLEMCLEDRQRKHISKHISKFPNTSILPTSYESNKTFILLPLNQFSRRHHVHRRRQYTHTTVGAPAEPSACSCSLYSLSLSSWPVNLSTLWEPILVTGGVCAVAHHDSMWWWWTTTTTPPPPNTWRFERDQKNNNQQLCINWPRQRRERGGKREREITERGARERECNTRRCWVRENSNQQWLINSECGGCRILRLLWCADRGRGARERGQQHSELRERESTKTTINNCWSPAANDDHHHHTNNHRTTVTMASDGTDHHGR